MVGGLLITWLMLFANLEQGFRQCGHQRVLEDLNESLKGFRDVPSEFH